MLRNAMVYYHFGPLPVNGFPGEPADLAMGAVSADRFGGGRCARLRAAGASLSGGFCGSLSEIARQGGQLLGRRKNWQPWLQVFEN